VTIFTRIPVGFATIEALRIAVPSKDERPRPDTLFPARGFSASFARQFFLATPVAENLK